MVGRLLSFWEGIFSGSMLNIKSVLGQSFFFKAKGEIGPQNDSHLKVTFFSGKKPRATRSSPKRFLPLLAASFLFLILAQLSLLNKLGVLCINFTPYIMHSCLLISKQKTRNESFGTCTKKRGAYVYFVTIRLWRFGENRK